MKFKNKIACITLFITFYGFSQPIQVLDFNTVRTGNISIGLFDYYRLIYFSADDSKGIKTHGGIDLGRELWVSEGTSLGTAFMKDLNSVASNSSPYNFFVQDVNLYFSANSGSGNKLYTIDSTEVKTVPVNM